mmetsp:Transcript_40074/g.72007  ORF Transcript_40074/g.72007 Transcript_40074/m.72007 type:complete len:176 (+) Transcript_40074:41-568(+)|eukprot:CAMPEP_0197623196 /NCGR_PEP_ID=MMETSP1338-20131121/3251_1 /TAXON_ID=43686 ORGANISM="Pelagodinium beii, Strain RCC1491" /NCGR_SAMPLE_ID=MMETSP1338 /ASSEMBLY_ACC=CAM_ASM_000754 /LENGTH=175 /DNA_ID=CAMNT_0043193089 /DNA_START=41 /DNA_END=571 /DNA_ORIENTATION=-
MALANVSRMLRVLPLMLALPAASGDANDSLTINNQSAQLSLRGSSSDQSAARRLGWFTGPDWKGCSALMTVHEGLKDHYCLCVESIYQDKCESCMCGDGSTSWCDTACDPHGDDPKNSCCMPFKNKGARCDQDWECGPMKNVQYGMRPYVGCTGKVDMGPDGRPVKTYGKTCGHY